MNSLSNENDKHSYYFDESEERYFDSPDLREILLILHLLCNDIDLIHLEQFYGSREPIKYYLSMYIEKALAGGIKEMRNLKRDMLNKR